MSHGEAANLEGHQDQEAYDIDEEDEDEAHNDLLSQLQQERQNLLEFDQEMASWELEMQLQYGIQIDVDAL